MSTNRVGRTPKRLFISFWDAYALTHTQAQNLKKYFQTFVRLLSPLDQFFPNSKSCRCFSRIVYRGSTYAKYITLSRIGGPFFCFFCLCCLSLPLSTSIFKFWPLAIISCVDQSASTLHQLSTNHEALSYQNHINASSWKIGKFESPFFISL